MCDFVFDIEKDSVESISALTRCLFAFATPISCISILFSNYFLIWRWHSEFVVSFDMRLFPISAALGFLPKPWPQKRK